MGFTVPFNPFQQVAVTLLLFLSILIVDIFPFMYNLFCHLLFYILSLCFVFIFEA